MVFSLSALWWRRIRGLWKLPVGRDSLRGKLGLVLVGKTVGAGAAAVVLEWLWGDIPRPRAKENLQQDGRRGETVFRIKLYTRQRCLEGTNVSFVHQDPETPQWLRQNCECLLWRYRSAVDCCRGGSSGCSRPGYGISPLVGRHHWEGNDTPLQCSCLENPRDGGAW